jgi:hypothetical protein
VSEDFHIGGTPRGHPEGALNLEVVKISNENLTTSGGLDAAETALRDSTDGAD